MARQACPQARPEHQTDRWLLELEFQSARQELPVRRTDHCSWAFRPELPAVSRTGRCSARVRLVEVPVQASKAVRTEKPELFPELQVLESPAQAFPAQAFPAQAFPAQAFPAQAFPVRASQVQV